LYSNSRKKLVKDMINDQIFKALFYLIVILLSLAVISSLILLAAARYIVSCLKTPPQNDAPRLKLGFWKKVFLGFLGGLVGEITAIAIFPSAESKWCSDMYAQGSYCDGQGPLVCILTVPLCAILGSCAAILWTWYSLRIRANSPWASVFRYSGGNRAANVGLAVAVQTVYWAIFAWAIYVFTCNLL